MPKHHKERIIKAAKTVAIVDLDFGKYRRMPER